MLGFFNMLGFFSMLGFFNMLGFLSMLGFFNMLGFFSMLGVPVWDGTELAATGLEEVTLVAIMAFFAAVMLPIKDFFWIAILNLLFFRF
jgi:hypothetical protein